METKEQMKETVGNLAMQATMLGGALVKHLLNEIEKSSNVSIDNQVFNKVLIYTSFFGLYIFRRRLQRQHSELLSTDKIEEIDAIFKEAFIPSIRILFTPKDERAFIDYMSESYDAMSQGYSEYRGDVSNLFYENLTSVFNADNSSSKIKFWTPDQFLSIEKFIEERSKSKLPWKHVSEERSQELLQEMLHKKGIEFVLPIEVLAEFAKNLNEEFETTDLFKK